MNKRWMKWAMSLLVFLACFLLLLALVPARPVGMDEVFPGWHEVRMGFIALVITLSLVGLWNLWGARKELWLHVPDFFRFQPLLFLLVRRDFIVRYKGSVLGVLWTVLNPLANMMILTIVFSTVFETTIPHFPAYVMAGTVLFTCFTESTNSGLISIVDSAPMLKKVYVPKYIFPIAKTMMPFLNLMFSIIALFIVMLITGAPFHIQMVMVPVAVLYLLVFCLGVSLLLSTLYVFFRDVKYLYTIVTTALLYMSAIFYDISIVPEQFMPLFALNPMLHIIRFFRTAVLYGQWPDLGEHVICAGIAVVTLVVGLVSFYKQQNKFILYI